MSQIHAPHYAVIFSSKRRAKEGDGYSEMAAKMDALARQQTGFLGIESVSSLRSGITISYWKDEDSIKSWKANLEHLLAQKKGRNEWYLKYEVKVAKVDRAYTGGIEPES
ncbi:hypothetical protein B0H10DRAFT_1792023 [Mycena sp. CBHHK59/15]|nr:hypothetical protein B0H10DRAFT_1792023 [Mycena sp. CBHHK59/15]